MVKSISLYGRLNVNPLGVTGQSSETLVAFEDGGTRHYLLPEVTQAWLRFKAAASAVGYKPIIVSAYRDFNRQLAIWNAKASGQRPVLDDAGNTIDMSALSALDKIHAIMRFSALPGASRHHWGSDFDIFETSQIETGYQCQLTLAETLEGGSCGGFYTWLSEYQQRPEFDFIRPYATDKGGVAIEPWHLSHAESANRYQALLSKALVRRAIFDQPLALKEAVLANFEVLYERYIEVNYS